MTYRELLNMCNKKPGWIKTKYQIEADTAVRNLLWEQKINDEFKQRKEKALGE